MQARPGLPHRYRGKTLHRAHSKTRLNAAHVGQASEMLTVQPFKIGQVFDDETDQVVVLTRHQITLHHFRNFPHSVLEGFKPRLPLSIERDGDEYVYGVTRLALIEQCGITLDQSTLFKGAHAP